MPTAIRTARSAAPAVPPDDDSCCAPAVESPLSDADAAGHAAILKALADPNRLRILALLAAQPNAEPLCVCDVEESFDLSQPTISHHLKVLREAGLVSVTKRGLWHHFAVTPEGLAPVRSLLTILAPA